MHRWQQATSDIGTSCILVPSLCRFGRFALYYSAVVPPHCGPDSAACRSVRSPKTHERAKARLENAPLELVLPFNVYFSDFKAVGRFHVLRTVCGYIASGSFGITSIVYNKLGYKCPEMYRRMCYEHTSTLRIHTHIEVHIHRRRRAGTIKK